MQGTNRSNNSRISANLFKECEKNGWVCGHIIWDSTRGSTPPDLMIEQKELQNLESLS